MQTALSRVRTLVTESISFDDRYTMNSSVTPTLSIVCLPRILNRILPFNTQGNILFSLKSDLLRIYYIYQFSSGDVFNDPPNSHTQGINHIIVDKLTGKSVALLRRVN